MMMVSGTYYHAGDNEGEGVGVVDDWSTSLWKSNLEILDDYSDLDLVSYQVLHVKILRLIL